eukprot:scaffold252743_cov29-Tisochrysis_lutea.AAC.3
MVSQAPKEAEPRGVGRRRHRRNFRESQRASIALERSATAPASGQTPEKSVTIEKVIASSKSSSDTAPACGIAASLAKAPSPARAARILPSTKRLTYSIAF